MSTQKNVGTEEKDYTHFLTYGICKFPIAVPIKTTINIYIFW